MKVWWLPWYVYLLCVILLLFLTYSFFILIYTGKINRAPMATSMLRFILWTFAIAGPCIGHNCNQLRGHFRVSADVVPPYLFKVSRGNGSEYDGVTKQILDFVFHPNLNASYEFVEADPKKVKENGNVKASIDQLLNGEANISTFGYIPTEERSRIMDYSGPIFIPQLVLIVPYPKEKSKLPGIVRPFQLPVWILLLVTLLIFVVMLSVLSKWYQKPLTGSDIRLKSFVNHVSDNAIYVLTALVGNGEYYRSRELRLRFVLSSWCLMCVVIINAYTGNLTSYLSVPAKETIPNSFEELAARKDLQLAVMKNSVTADIVMKSTSGPLKTLRDQLRQNPQYLYHTPQDGLDFLATRKVAIAAPITQAIQIVNAKLEKYKECRLTYSKPLSLHVLYVYGFPKNWPYKDAFNSRLQYIRDTGLLDQWFRMYVKQQKQCVLKKKDAPRKAAMKLEDFFGAFVLLAAGFTLSLLAYLLEVVAGKVKHHRKNQTTD